MKLSDSLSGFQNAESLDMLYPLLDLNQMTAGWHKKRPSLWATPQTSYQPMQWHYETGKVALDRAGLWINTELAERRNLLLFNRVDDNDYDTVRSLVAAYQMVKPGEYARAHRHSPNALRIILEAPQGCYTVVDGIKLPMLPGDLLLTPGNAWHSHFNEGDQNAYWIDILDVPLVHRLEPMFVEHLPGSVQDVEEEPKAHPFAFSLNKIKREIQKSSNDSGVRYLEIDSKNILKTMTISYHQFDAGAQKAYKRNTANRIFCVLEGSGVLKTEIKSFYFKFGDVIAIPTWNKYSIQADKDSTLIEVSDENTMSLLGFYREDSCN